MQKAIINIPICPLKRDPDVWQETPERSCLDDEVLLGMTVELTGEEKKAADTNNHFGISAGGMKEEEEVPWVHVRTDYGYEGWIRKDALVFFSADNEEEAYLQAVKKTVYCKHFADVLAIPKVQGAFVMQDLPMGAVVRVTGEAQDGWQKVMLPDGREGYVFAGVLRDYRKPVLLEKFTLGAWQEALWGSAGGSLSPEHSICREAQLRRALTDTARLYAGSHYRWGGKTPAGIDCSGLCSMAYLLNGIVIYRDADIRDGFPVRQISPDNVKEGDLLFFPGHVAMYLGRGEYIHATAKPGSDGVTINSLDPDSYIYREDLAKGITMAGSLFG